MFSFSGNWTRSIRWKVMVSSSRLLTPGELKVGERACRSQTHISWYRMRERSSALDASDRSMSESILNGSGGWGGFPCEEQSCQSCIVPILVPKPELGGWGSHGLNFCFGRSYDPGNMGTYEAANPEPCLPFLGAAASQGLRHNLTHSRNHCRVQIIR